MLIVGARLSQPDPRLNVGFREGTVIGSGEGMNDAVRLVYSGGPLSQHSDASPEPSGMLWRTWIVVMAGGGGVW